MSKQIIRIGVPLAVAYATYRVKQLNNLYPLSAPADYHQTPSILPKLPRNFGETDYIYARLPYTAPRDGTPLEDLISSFYATWTLRVEGLVSRLIKFQTPPEILVEGNSSFCNGLFPIYQQIAHSVFVQWKFTPTRKHAEPQKSRFSIWSIGGTQELTAVEKEESGKKYLEISYACAQYSDREGESLPGPGLSLHRFYMRFLLDAARRRLEKRVEAR